MQDSKFSCHNTSLFCIEGFFSLKNTAADQIYVAKNALKRKNFRFFNECIESTLHKGKVLCYQMIVSMNTKATK